LYIWEVVWFVIIWVIWKNINSCAFQAKKQELAEMMVIWEVC